jgi:hypothetical protein
VERIVDDWWMCGVRFPREARDHAHAVQDYQPHRSTQRSDRRWPGWILVFAREYGTQPAANTSCTLPIDPLLSWCVSPEVSAVSHH